MIGKIFTKSSAKGTGKGGEKAGPGSTAIDGVAERKPTFATRSYAPDDILATTGGGPIEQPLRDGGRPATDSRGPQRGGGRPAAGAGSFAASKKGGLRYRKDGRVEPKGTSGAGDSSFADEALEDLFDPAGRDLLPRVILWVIGVLAVAGLLVALLVLFAVARQVVAGDAAGGRSRRR